MKNKLVDCKVGGDEDLPKLGKNVTHSAIEKNNFGSVDRKAPGFRSRVGDIYSM